MRTSTPTSVRHVEWMQRNGILPPDTSPRQVLACTAPGCDAAWFEPRTWDSVSAKVISVNHSLACRRARVAGWTGDDSTTCLCGNREIRCPDHAKARGLAEPHGHPSLAPLPG